MALSNTDKESRKVNCVRRQVFVEQMMMQGLSAQSMANLKDSAGKAIASYQTIRNDIKFIQTQWLIQDPEWINRARIARLLAEKRLEDIQVRLHAFLQRPEDDVTIKERIGIVSLIQENTMKLLKVGSMFDPEQYLNHILTEKAEEDANRQREGTDTSTQRESTINTRFVSG